jgi:hypothetical protein
MATRSAAAQRLAGTARVLRLLDAAAARVRDAVKRSEGTATGQQAADLLRVRDEVQHAVGELRQMLEGDTHLIQQLIELVDQQEAASQAGALAVQRAEQQLMKAKQSWHLERGAFKAELTEAQEQARTLARHRAVLMVVLALTGVAAVLFWGIPLAR